MIINFKHKIKAATINDVIDKVTQQLQKAGFGVLTNINFANKLKEKIGVDIPPTVVLGACNPKLAFEVYQETTDFLSLIPCNVVIRHLDKDNYAIEMIKPSVMIKALENPKISAMAIDMDNQMQELLSTIN
ncbi:MAG: hypothetical protein RL017_246 [Pseudomonadota bacterium]|jgi:uncharacterized protein (DUF302 family)|nr:DUF302 domain-containing protein [Burkholderiales bacterium]